MKKYIILLLFVLLSYSALAYTQNAYLIINGTIQQKPMTGPKFNACSISGGNENYSYDCNLTNDKVVVTIYSKEYFVDKNGNLGRGFINNKETAESLFNNGTGIIYSDDTDTVVLHYYINNEDANSFVSTHSGGRELENLPVCGNNVCDASESPINCPTDCKMNVDYILKTHNLTIFLIIATGFILYFRLKNRKKDTPSDWKGTYYDSGKIDIKDTTNYGSFTNLELDKIHNKETSDETNKKIKKNYDGVL